MERKQTLSSAPDAPCIFSAIFFRSIPRIKFIFLECIFRISQRDWVIQNIKLFNNMKYQSDSNMTTRKSIIYPKNHSNSNNMHLFPILIKLFASLLNHPGGISFHRNMQGQGEKRQKELLLMDCTVVDDSTVRTAYYLFIWTQKLNLPVNPSWPQKGLVKDINSICSH